MTITNIGFLNLRNSSRFEFTSDAGADTEFTVEHKLGRIPTGYIVLEQDGAGSLYKDSGGTEWDRQKAYFKCDQSSITFIVVFV